MYIIEVNKRVDDIYYILYIYMGPVRFRLWPTITVAPRQ